ncbi:MAG: hypothetical protein ACO1SX_20130 [Actinomycetota bacterium]
MKPDVTTKLILAAIAGGLWALALRPAFIPTPAVADDPEPSAVSSPTLALGTRMTGVYVLQGGRVYRFKEDLGKPTAVGIMDPTAR